MKTLNPNTRVYKGERGLKIIVNVLWKMLGIEIGSHRRLAQRELNLFRIETGSGRCFQMQRKLLSDTNDNALKHLQSTLRGRLVT